MGWTVFGATCYFFSSESLSWTESRDWCETQQAHLVILLNDKEWVRPVHLHLTSAALHRQLNV